MVVDKLLIVLEVILRSRSFTVIFLGLMIFSATLTSILLISNYTSEEARYVADKIVFVPTPMTISIVSSRVLHNIQVNNKIVGCLVESKIIKDNITVYVDTILLNTSYLGKLRGSNGILLEGVGNYNKGVIIPLELSKKLNIKIGDKISIVINGNRTILNVIGEYKIRLIRNIMPIVISTFKYRECKYWVVLSNNTSVDYRRVALYGIIDTMDKQISMIAYNWLILLSSVYLVLSFLLVKRFIEESMASLRILAIQGLGISMYVAFSFLIVSIIVNMIGVGLGLIVVHGALWVSRFLGLVFPLRPMLSYEIVLVALIYGVITANIAWITVMRSIKG